MRMRSLPVVNRNDVYEIDADEIYDCCKDDGESERNRRGEREVVGVGYTKVAQGKSRLSLLIFAQAVLQLIGAVNIFYATSEKGSLDRLAVSSTVLCFISLIFGELGRKHSRALLLRFYIIVSSIGMLLSIACALGGNLSFKVIQDLGGWETKKFELFRTTGLLIGFLVQILSISTTVSLIGNMSPPKRAS
ncbi:hypothetical protein RJ639_027809 [Escallonia herrerae]|uniref:Uncharacterized protein n=1 Tax=Escallonia herrerae TaxID=1293975 RepID=A0AA88X546_9ASTE|nr:hypothetical protein RJ639_027809 [Escallonia herrerae]